MTNSTRATSQWTGADDILNVLVHAPQVRLPVVLGLLSMMSALMPGVTLYGLTRDQDPELALPALTCRAGEGVLGAIPTLATVALLSLSTAKADSQSAATCPHSANRYRAGGAQLRGRIGRNIPASIKAAFRYYVGQ